MSQNASVIRHREGLTTRVAGDDVLVLDGDHVAALEGDTARVWNASDGKTIAEVALETGLSESVVAACLAQIDDAGLLQAGGLSRRALMARAGLVGAGAAGAVLVTALPAAALTGSSTAAFSAAEGTTSQFVVVTGSGFASNATVAFSAVNNSNSKSIPFDSGNDSTDTDVNGDFTSVTLEYSASHPNAGSISITATDGTSTVPTTYTVTPGS